MVYDLQFYRVVLKGFSSAESALKRVSHDDLNDFIKQVVLRTLLNSNTL